MYILEIRKHYCISFLRITGLQRRGRDQKEGDRKQHNDRPEDVAYFSVGTALHWARTYF